MRVWLPKFQKLVVPHRKDARVKAFRIKFQRYPLKARRKVMRSAVHRVTRWVKYLLAHPLNVLVGFARIWVGPIGYRAHVIPVPLESVEAVKIGQKVAC